MYSLEWCFMAMESLMWSFMLCMILCGFIWFSIVYYANVFPCKVSNCLVWLCLVLYGLTQLCTFFVLVIGIGNGMGNHCQLIKIKHFGFFNPPKGHF